MKVRLVVMAPPSHSYRYYGRQDARVSVIVCLSFCKHARNECTLAKNIFISVSWSTAECALSPLFVAFLDAANAFDKTPVFVPHS